LKRFTAIVLLAVLLFNLYGYQLVIGYMQQQHEVILTAQLDKDEYRNEDLISIKTPLSMPYYNRSLAFERVDGSIRIDGVEYRYVKRRIVADSLELLCLPNTTKQKLQTAKADYFKIANDLQQPENGKKAVNIIKAVQPEYCNGLMLYTFLSPRFTKQKHPRTNSLHFSSRYVTTPEQPPETMTARA
jgi:hypothetical protein